MSESDPGSFPVALLILIISVIIIFVILAIAQAFNNNGTADEQDTQELLKGVFSFSTLLDKSLFVAVDGRVSGSKLVLSNSVLIPCNDYRWVYNQNDQTLEWGGNQADTLDSQKLVATVDLTPGTSIELREKGTAGSLNQWVYDINNLTWCLKSNSNLCMNSFDETITLETPTESQTFNWIITRDLIPPACT